MPIQPKTSYILPEFATQLPNCRPPDASTISLEQDCPGNRVTVRAALKNFVLKRDGATLSWWRRPVLHPKRRIDECIRQKLTWVFDNFWKSPPPPQRKGGGLLIGVSPVMKCCSTIGTSNEEDEFVFVCFLWGWEMGVAGILWEGRYSEKEFFCPVFFNSSGSFSWSASHSSSLNLESSFSAATKWTLTLLICFCCCSHGLYLLLSSSIHHFVDSVQSRYQDSW